MQLLSTTVPQKGDGNLIHRRLSWGFSRFDKESAVRGSGYVQKNQPRDLRAFEEINKSRPCCVFHYSAQCVLCSVRCPCIFYGPLVTTIRRRGGYRGIFGEEGVDTGVYFGGNHRFRVWNSGFPHESCFPSNRTSRDKYMLNNLSRRNF